MIRFKQGPWTHLKRDRPSRHVQVTSHLRQLGGKLTRSGESVDLDDFSSTNVVADDAELLVSEAKKAIVRDVLGEALLAARLSGEQSTHGASIDLNIKARATF